jgi:phage-related baseplate assembly protein
MTLIDLSRLPAPDVIEALDYEALLSGFKQRFLIAWATERAVDPTLPAYDVDGLETDPVVILGEAWSYLRLLDRARVNDAVKAVLAPLARGSNLDTVAARLGVERLVIQPASGTAPAVMESDDRLLARYLLAFGRPSAGSAARYLYEAYTAWPQLLHAAVIGRAIHGRRGDIDLVLAGPGGRDPTPEELERVRDAVLDTSVKPEAVSVTVLRALRRDYAVVGRIVVEKGPDAELVRLEAVRRLEAAGTARLAIGAQVPRSLLAGALYGASIVRADLDGPAGDLPAEPYTIPVLAGVTLSVEVAP